MNNTRLTPAMTTGITTTAASLRALRWVVTAAVLAASSQVSAGSSSCEVKVKNCGDMKMVMRSYNGSDSSNIIAYDDAIVSVGSTRTLECSGSSCGIAAEFYGDIDKASEVVKFDCDETAYIRGYDTDTGGYDYEFSDSSCPN